MKKILVPVGNSPDSYQTLQYAVDFAAAFGAAVYVMEVLNLSSGAGDLTNIREKAVESSGERTREMIGKIEPGPVEIKATTYSGDLIDGLKELDRELGIDLIIIAPRSVEVDDALYLGSTSGRIIKRTDIPTLIVPRGLEFAPYKKILTAFKSGVLKRNRILAPLMDIQKKFDSAISLLLVKTPGYTDDDLKINTALMDISDRVTMTQQASTYLGVLEQLESHQPDLLCVFRRKRGFFSVLWEKNRISKSEFSVRLPVLVLSVKKY